MGKKKNDLSIWVADFETTTDPSDCRVWAWAACVVGAPEILEYGNTIEGFMSWLKNEPDEVWFHNLAFDGEFIIYWCLTHGYHVAEQGSPRVYPLMSAMGKFYSMDIEFSNAHVVTLKDSLKKLPMSAAAVAKAFDLPIQKLEIDYNEYRAPGHQLTDQELDYIKNDVGIISMALAQQFEHGLTRLTAASDAFYFFKRQMCPSNKHRNDFQYFFPTFTVEADRFYRRAYRGGWTYANPVFQGQDMGAGQVYDVNSLYPSVMRARDYPISMPLYYKGRYTHDETYPLYFQRLRCSLELKPHHLPTLQIKGDARFKATQYVTSTGGEIVELVLPKPDLELLVDHYDLKDVEWICGFKFLRAFGSKLFGPYIDHWSEIKANSTGGRRAIAKLMLNSLYGKFGSNPDKTGKLPYLKEGRVAWFLDDPNIGRPIYCPLAAYVTAYARDVTIRAAQKNVERFLYADTDSLHLLGNEAPSGLEVHPTRLGAWANEAGFERGRYIRAKSYIEEITTQDGHTCAPHLSVTCAGMPKNLHPLVTWENFQPGLELFGKLVPKHVPGGIVLTPTTFTLHS